MEIGLADATYTYNLDHSNYFAHRYGLLYYESQTHHCLTSTA